MKELLWLVALFAVVMVMFGRVPTSLQNSDSDAWILYNDNTVKSNDLFFGVHVRADDSEDRVSWVSNLWFAWKKNFWDSIFGRFTQSNTNSDDTALVASTQTNDLFDDTDSTTSETFVSPCEVRFVDVATHVHVDAITTAAKYCLVDGYSSTRFYPDNHLRREELAKITVNMMLLKLEWFVRQFEWIDYDPFADVLSTNQLAPYISYATRLGVWEDLFPDSSRRNFDPQGLVTPQDMIVLLGDIARMYPNYMDTSRISVDIGDTWMTRAEALNVMMDFFRGNTDPSFASERA